MNEKDAFTEKAPECNSEARCAYSVVDSLSHAAFLELLAAAARTFFISADEGTGYFGSVCLRHDRTGLYFYIWF